MYFSFPLLRQRNGRKSFDPFEAIEYIPSSYMLLPNVDIRSICSKFCVSYVLYILLASVFFCLRGSGSINVTIHRFWGLKYIRYGEKVYQPLVIWLYILDTMLHEPISNRPHKGGLRLRYSSSSFYCRKFISHGYIFSNKNAINFSPTIYIHF